MSEPMTPEEFADALHSACAQQRLAFVLIDRDKSPGFVAGVVWRPGQQRHRVSIVFSDEERTSLDDAALARLTAERIHTALRALENLAETHGGHHS